MIERLLMLVMWDIAALDPAQPAFEGEDSVVRLNASDAQFVDVVHTNGVPLEPFVGLGMTRPVGESPAPDGPVSN